MSNSTAEIFEIIVFDVGQADCIHVQLPDGRQFLVDTGYKKTFSNVKTELMNLGKKIDFIILTHDHSDHTSALYDFIKDDYFNIQLLLYWMEHPQRGPSSVKAWGFIEEKQKQQKIDIKDIKRMHEYEGLLGDHVKLLFPQSETIYNSASKNHNSIVLALEHDGNKVLLMGDAPKASEYLLIQKSLVPTNTSLIKIGHHGSNSSSSPEFFEVILSEGIHPELVCSCNGTVNPPPHYETIEMFNKMNLSITRTATSSMDTYNVRIRVHANSNVTQYKWGEII